MAKRREDEMSSAEVPENGRIKIDVISPAFRPGDKLEQLLKRLQKQTWRPNRIIIMNTERQ